MIAMGCVTVKRSGAGEIPWPLSRGYGQSPQRTYHRTHHVIELIMEMWPASGRCWMIASSRAPANSHGP
jgi:hypothetical protein